MTENNFLARNARWLTAGFLLTFASSLGQTFFIALFAPQLRAEMGLSHGEFGSVYTAATLMSALVMVWLGRTADSVRVHTLAAAVLVTLGAAALAMSQVASVLALAGAVFGLRLFGQGMPGHVAATAMARWYEAGRGRALSLTGLGRAAGEAVLPSVVVALIAAVGWRTTWVIAAAATALVIMPICFTLLSRPPPPDARSTMVGAGAGKAAPPREWTRGEVARDPVFYMLLLGVVAPPFILTGVFFHQAHIVAVKGWTLAAFAATFPAFSGGAVAVALATGWAIDRWSARRLLPYCLLPMALGLAILAEAGEVVWAFAFMGLSGASNGFSSTLASALWAELYGTRNIGAVRSLVMAAVVGSTAIAPGIMGVLVDAGIGVASQIMASAIYTFLVSAILFGLSLKVRRLSAG